MKIKYIGLVFQYILHYKVSYFFCIYFMQHISNVFIIPSTQRIYALNTSKYGRLGTSNKTLMTNEYLFLLLNWCNIEQ